MKHHSDQVRNNATIILTTALLIVIWAFNMEALRTGNYIIHKEDLFKIDSVKMLSRAYKLTGRAKGIEFVDESGRTYLISGARYNAIPDNSRLYDTLQYSKLVMTVFTNKYGQENHRNNSDKIEVYNIEVGKTSFIDLDDINTSDHRTKRNSIIFISIVYCVALIYYFRQRKKINRARSK